MTTVKNTKMNSITREIPIFIKNETRKLNILFNMTFIILEPSRGIIGSKLNKNIEIL